MMDLLGHHAMCGEKMVGGIFEDVAVLLWDVSFLIIVYSVTLFLQSIDLLIPTKCGEEEGMVFGH